MRIPNIIGCCKEDTYSIRSMYDIFPYIWLLLMVLMYLNIPVLRILWVFQTIIFSIQLQYVKFPIGRTSDVGRCHFKWLSFTWSWIIWVGFFSIASMYGFSTCIYQKHQETVGEYTIIYNTWIFKKNMLWKIKRERLLVGDVNSGLGAQKNPSQKIKGDMQLGSVDGRLTIWDIQNLVNIGINYQPQLVNAWFLNHQQYYLPVSLWKGDLLIFAGNISGPFSVSWQSYDVNYLGVI